MIVVLIKIKKQNKKEAICQSKSLLRANLEHRRLRLTSAKMEKSRRKMRLNDGELSLNDESPMRL